MKSVTKIKINSYNICYGPKPKPYDEVEQHLTIRSDDRFWLSRYNYGEGFGNYTLASKKTGKLYNGRATRILSLIENYCEKNALVPMVTDCGSWELNVYYDDGSTTRISGSLVPEDDDLNHISDLIRKELNDYSLDVFNGSYDNNYPMLSPIFVFEKYLPLLYEDTFLWQKFQELCKSFFYNQQNNCRFFAFIRDPAVITTWEGLLDNMGGGIPVYFFEAAAFIILSYKEAGHDIDRELEVVKHGNN